MPEIAEVARIVHYLKKSLVGKTLNVVKAQDDTNVFGKVGTTGAEVQKALQGKKVLDAGRQGKYFWLVMSSPPHPVFHFGMTGWFYIKGEPSIHYRPKDEDDTWPPKYWKLSLETDGEPKIQAAFTDSRRFARIRLVDCAGKDIRNTTPLKENGPDPVIDKHILTEEWLEEKLSSKKVSIKALLLDQANISGIGNWVGDEIMYHAKLHPEQYSNTFTSAQSKQLHASMMHVCDTAVALLADSSKFPEDWLFNHRWGKGKKDAPTILPNGERITFLTVGGRTSCIVPSLQRKTGAVAGDVEKEITEATGEDDTEPARKAKVAKTLKKKTSNKGDEDVSDGELNGEEPRAQTTLKKEVPRKRKTRPWDGIEEKENTKDDTGDDSKPTVPNATRTKASRRKKELMQGSQKATPEEMAEPVAKTKKQRASSEISSTSQYTLASKAESRRRSGRLSNEKL